MEVLPKLLKDLKINSLKDFNQYMHHNNGPLKVIRKENLESVFSCYEVKENEIHSDFIELKNRVLDVAQLSVFPKSGIVLKNCICTGKVRINGKNCSESTTIEIENCIFVDELIITGFSKNHSKKIYIFHTNAAYSSLFNIKASEIILTGCKFCFLALHKIESVKFEAENNYFKHFEMESGQFGEVIFDHRQFDINSIGRRIIKKVGRFPFESFPRMSADMNLFSFIPYKTSADIRKNESYNTMLETIDFLKNSTSLNRDRNKYTQLIFFEVLLAQDKPLHKAFVRITGGFLKPFRFVLIAIIVLSFFTALYMLPILEFNSAGGGLTRSLPFDEALYFSGITFTTIGYGDISPVGISRVFAILEGIFGISTMSGFLVALVKKYID